MTDLSEILDGVRGSRCQIGADPVGSRISTHTGYPLRGGGGGFLSIMVICELQKSFYGGISI